MSLDREGIIHVSRDQQDLAFVPLAKGKGIAVIDGDDLKMLEALGLSLRWNRSAQTGVVFAPASRASGGNILVGRVLVDAGPGENVHYRDGDPTNLRRANLEINPDGNATRRDRDFITPSGKRHSWGPAVTHHYLKAKGGSD